MADAFLDSLGRLDISEGVIGPIPKLYLEDLAFLAGISELEMGQDSAIFNGPMLAGAKWSTRFIRREWNRIAASCREVMTDSEKKRCYAVVFERLDPTAAGGKTVTDMSWEKAPLFVRQIFMIWTMELLGFYEWEDYATVHYYG